MTLYICKKFNQKNMKKYFVMAFACLTGMMMQSCGEGDSHALRVVYPSQKYLYADETKDSIIFQTMDSWTLQADNNWTTFRNGANSYSEMVAHRNDAIYEFSQEITFTPNNTGKRRASIVSVISYEYICSAVFEQRPIFNFSHPSPFEVWEPDVYTLELQDKATDVEDSICFKVKKPWQIEVVEPTDWITISPASGGSGKAKAVLTLTPNTTGADRTVKLKVISSDVENVVTLTQTAQ